MRLAAYYDSSSDETQSIAVTLTGVAAAESVWQEFDDRWTAALDCVGALHMAPLMSSCGRFSGWTEDQKLSLLCRLWNVVGGFRNHLTAYTCTVLLRDWKQAKAENQSLRSPHSICVNFCVGGLALPEGCTGEPKPIILYFDQNENFMHKVNRVWQRWKKQNGTFFSYIDDIKKADNSAPPVQLADMLAWISNNRALGRSYSLKEFLELPSVLMIEHVRRTYHYETIQEIYPNGALRNHVR